MNTSRRDFLKGTAWMGAATSCLCELTETSVRSGSKLVSIPDFTRGNWRNVKPWDIVNVDLKKMGLDKDSVSTDKAALNV